MKGCFKRRREPQGDGTNIIARINNHMIEQRKSDFEEAVRLGHEQEAVNAGRVFQIGAALAVVVVAAMLLVTWFGGVLIRNEPTEPPTTALPPTASPLPSPRLDADQPMELRKLRQREERELSSYEWIDLERNTARIPIQRAIEIMAEDSQASQSPVKDRSKGSDQS